MLKKSIKTSIAVKVFSVTAFALMGMWIIPAQAHTIIAENNTSISVDISTNDITQIAVENDRINLLRGTAGAYTASNDIAEGAIFIKPTINQSASLKICPVSSKTKNKTQSKKQKHCSHAFKKYVNPKPFYVFISTEKGHYYVLLLTPNPSLHADIVLLKPKEAETAAAKAWENSETYPHTLIGLVTALIHQQAPSGYTQTVFKKPQEFSLGKTLILKRIERYTGDKLNADIYQVINHAHDKISLTEKEFYQPGDHAIYLQQSSLAPGQSTQLIKVISHE